jgi:hypothetical protein
LYTSIRQTPLLVLMYMQSIPSQEPINPRRILPVFSVAKSTKRDGSPHSMALRYVILAFTSDRRVFSLTKKQQLHLSFNHKTEELRKTGSGAVRSVWEGLHEACNQKIPEL